MTGVCVGYGRRPVVRGLTLTVHRGESFGLLGANGSGKSTALAAAAGLLRPSSGEIRIDGRRHEDGQAEYAARVGFVPQESALYDELTVGENLRLFGRLHGLRGRGLRRRTAACLAEAALTDRAGQRVGTLSGGLKRRADLACSLMHEPAVLLLDEPTAALDSESRGRVRETLRRLAGEGRAVVLTTHLPREAEDCCGRVGVLTGGVLSSPDDPRSRPCDAA